MKKLLLLTALWSTAALAGDSVKLGQAVNAEVSLCTTRVVAESVIRLHVSEGEQAAADLFHHACFSATVNVIPMKVLCRYRVDGMVLKVIQAAVLLKDGKRGEFFLITGSPIDGEV